MGANRQCPLSFDSAFALKLFPSACSMLPPMKSMKAAGARTMTKGALLKAIGDAHGLKRKACSNVLNSMMSIATSEIKKTGKFTVPGLCRIKTKFKPATKACVKNIFGKETQVKAKPAKTVVKAYPVAGLKKQI